MNIVFLHLPIHVFFDILDEHFGGERVAVNR